MPSVKTQPLYALRQEFVFIDGLGTYVDEKESRTNARYNPWPKPNLTRIALLEKYAETWKVRAKDWQGHKLRESVRDNILNHIDDAIENQKEIWRGLAINN